jgi:hypothetical protein
LGTASLSTLWSALKAHFRPTVEPLSAEKTIPHFGELVKY